MNLNRLLEISVYAVLLFLIVIVIKKIFSRKMSPTLHFAIWFMLIARLCIPFTIESSIRLIVIPQETIKAFQTSASGQLQWGPPLVWTDYFFILWLSGVLLLSIRMLVNMTRMNREIKRNSTQPSSSTQEFLNLCRNELRISRKIKLYLLPGITTPALTIGIIPKIVLPSDIHDRLSDKQLELAIKHELMHYKRRDYLIVMLLRVLEVIYWFNPIVWLMSRHVSLDMESACDSMVVKNLNNQQKKAYALCLVRLSSHGRSLQSALGLVFGNNQKIVEKRIRGVFVKGQRKRNMIVAAGILAVVLFIGGFTTIFLPIIKTEIKEGNQIANATPVTSAQSETESLDNIVTYNDSAFVYITDFNKRNSMTLEYYPIGIGPTGTSEATYVTLTITPELAEQIRTSLRDNVNSNHATP